MSRAVVKHSYVKGTAGIGKAKAHIRYIEHRRGEDRGEKRREFFNDERDGIKRQEIYERIDEQSRNGVQIHKLILSPGVQDVDLKQYTQETMREIGKEKGLDLDWYGVIHKNTDHDHVHVVVMAQDKNGHRVSFRKDDYRVLRETGDRYLEREHTYDRYLDREMELLLKHPERQRELEYKRDRGDDYFEQLMYGPKDEKKRGDPERDRREWEQLDKDLHKAFQREYDRGDQRPLGFKQWNIEQAGRLSDLHERYSTHQAKEYWKEAAERDPEGREGALQELAEIERLEREAHMERFKDVDIDRLMDGKNEHQRFLDRILEEDKERIDEYFQDREEQSLPAGRDEELDRLLGWEHNKSKEIDRKEREPELEDLFTPSKDKEREAEEYQQRTGFAGGRDEAEEAAQTFEADRLTQDQQQSQDHERERDDLDLDRGDDFGR